MIIESSWDVKSVEIFTKDKESFHELGLFSEPIFGPLEDFVCRCGNFNGIKYSGQRCPECSVIVGPSSLRRYTISRIKLPFEIINPILCYLLPATILKNILQDNTDESCYVDAEKFINSLSHTLKNKISFFINEIKVLPPAIRPISRLGQKILEMDKINNYYLLILNQIIKYNEIEQALDKSILLYTKKTILKTAIILYKHIVQLLSKKEGLIRQAVLGKRNDFTGRSVIIVDPSLKINQARIPYRILAACWQPLLIYELAQQIDYITAYELSDKYIKNPSSLSNIYVTKIEEILDRLCKNRTILLNRQPTLHRVSIQGFYPLGTKKDTISLPMLVCAAFNADFDGDTMAVYAPLTDNANNEVKEKILASTQLLVPGSLEFKGFTQDLVLGLFYITVHEFNQYKPITVTDINTLSSYHPWTKVIWKEKQTTAGKAYISEITEQEITDVLTKKDIIKIINNYLIRHSHDENVEMLYALQKYALQYNTRFTISIDDCKPIDEEIIKEFKNIKKWNAQHVQDLSHKLKTLRETTKFTPNISAIIHSGARGNTTQWFQVIGMRGLVKNTVGKLILPPILNSLINGYDTNDIIRSAAGNRKGVIDKALNTAIAGYLTRKLVFSLQHILISDNEFCNTTQGLKVEITKKNMHNFLYRYTLDNQYITPQNVHTFIDKTIHIYSPIYCLDKKGLCKKCCPYIEKFKSPFVGFIAAQSIGEIGTQLSMRTFHTGGAAEAKTFNLPNVLKVDDMDICYTTDDIEIIVTEPPLIDNDNLLLADFDVIINTNNEEQVLTISMGTKLLHTFNSGSIFLAPKTPLFKINTMSEDITTDLAIVCKKLNANSILTTQEALNQMWELQKLYENYQRLLSIHFEILWSERMRHTDGKYFRFNPLGEDQTIKLESIANIPHNRLILSLCFENFRKFFKTLLESTHTELSPLEKLISNDMIQLSLISEDRKNEHSFLAETSSNCMY